AATLRKSPALCEKSTLAVARLLRRQIDAAREGMWPLVDEIRLLDEYLDLDRAHGARRRVVIHVDPASEGRVVWPGSLAVEVSSLLARPDFPIGDVSIELHESGPALRASIRAASAEHALTIEPPPVSPASRPEARLGDMASALARHHRLSIVAIMVAFWLLSTLTAALMSRSGWAAPLPLFLIAARTAARMLFVVPVVASLDSTRPVAPLRFFFAVMAAAAAGEWWIQIAIGRAFGNPWDAVFIFSSAVMLSSVAFVYVSVAATAGTLYMVRVSRVADERNRQAFVVAQRLRDAQARFLMWQTNPHFLFNALNSLVALTRSSRDSAARFLTALETFYEDMTAVRGQTHPIESEVALLARYFVIEKVRFGDAISFDALVPDEVREAEVPTLLLQPLVENATKHGAMQHGRLPITLRACLAGGRLQITVTNPADPCEAVRKAGSGLAITRERLAAMYGEAASCRTSVENGMFIAAIDMPLVIRAAGEVLQKPEFRAIATQPTHS
ncbi:MAG TPA: histidine kinase, partial [Thermoanaerobaculia bacterium]|nr:histidine kinase [Thermoanaerobaculia bacterium]